MKALNVFHGSAGVELAHPQCDIRLWEALPEVIESLSSLWESQFSKLSRVMHSFSYRRTLIDVLASCAVF